MRCSRGLSIKSDCMSLKESRNKMAGMCLLLERVRLNSQMAKLTESKVTVHVRASRGRPRVGRQEGCETNGPQIASPFVFRLLPVHVYHTGPGRCQSEHIPVTISSLLIIKLHFSNH